MATYNNDTKPTSTYTNDKINYIDTWDDSLVAWDSGSVAWDDSRGAPSIYGYAVYGASLYGQVGGGYDNDTKPTSSYNNDTKPS